MGVLYNVYSDPKVLTFWGNVEKGNNLLALGNVYIVVPSNPE